MPINSLFRGYGFNIHTQDISPAQTLAGITSFDISDNIQINREFTDGNIYPTKTTKTSSSEAITATTVNVDDAIDIIGVQGLCIRGTTETGVDFYLQDREECNTGAAPGGRRYRVSVQATSGGLLVPQSLTCAHQGDAQFSFLAAIKGLNGNAGISKINAITLPAIVDNKNRFTLGKFTIDGVNYEGKKNLNINFGVRTLTESADSSPFPEWISIDQIESVIDVTGIDPDWLNPASIPSGGKTFTHVNCSFYLRKRSLTGDGFEPDASPVHIKVTAAGRAYVTQLTSGSGNSVAQTAMRLFVEHDGTNIPIIINTNQAIT